MKTAKITASKFKSKWSPPDKPNQVTYYHDIELDNGDRGSIGTNEQEPQFLNVGESLTYDIGPHPKRAGDFQIKKAGSWGGKGGGGFAKEPFEEKAVGMSYAFAKDLTVAGKLEPGKKMIETANAIYDAMLATAKRGRV